MTELFFSYNLEPVFPYTHTHTHTQMSKRARLTDPEEATEKARFIGKPLFIPVLASKIAGGLDPEEVINLRQVCSNTRFVQAEWPCLAFVYSEQSRQTVLKLALPLGVREVRLIGNVRGDGLGSWMTSLAPNIETLSSNIYSGSHKWVNEFRTWSWPNLRDLRLNISSKAADWLCNCPSLTAHWRLETLVLNLTPVTEHSFGLLHLFVYSILEGGTKATLKNLGLLMEDGELEGDFWGNVRGTRADALAVSIEALELHMVLHSLSLMSEERKLGWVAMRLFLVQYPRIWADKITFGCNINRDEFPCFFSAETRSCLRDLCADELEMKHPVAFHAGLALAVPSHTRTFRVTFEDDVRHGVFLGVYAP